MRGTSSGWVVVHHGSWAVNVHSTTDLALSSGGKFIENNHLYSRHGGVQTSERSGCGSSIVVVICLWLDGNTFGQVYCLVISLAGFHRAGDVWLVFVLARVHARTHSTS